MKGLKHLLLCFALSLGTLAAQAQDIHFSQFYMAPLSLNPAMAGVMNCKVRFIGNYRNQWASVLRSNAYNTYSATYDQKFAVGRYDYLGLGVNFWGDRAGSANFSTLQGKLALSYAKRMGGSRKSAHYLVAGLEGGVGQRSLDFLALQYGEQHDGNGGFNPNLPSGEIWDQNNLLFPELGAGLMWFSVLNPRANWYAGAAVHHLTRANQSFLRDNYIGLYTKFTIHAGAEFMLGERVGMVPGFVSFFQGPSFQLNTGTSFKFLLGDNRLNSQSFQVGTWVRLANRFDGGLLTDAVILSTRFDMPNFGVGFSYDINASSLRPASNANGGFEFSIIYKICGPENRGVYCPNF